MNILSDKGHISNTFQAKQKPVRLHQEVFVSLCKVLGKKHYQIEKILDAIKIKNSTIKQNRGLAPLVTGHKIAQGQ